MLVGVAFLLPSNRPSGTQAFYIIKRQNCLNICNTVYLMNQSNQNSNWKKLLGFRNMQENLENVKFYLQPNIQNYVTATFLYRFAIQTEKKIYDSLIFRTISARCTTSTFKPVHNRVVIIVARSTLNTLVIYYWNFFIRRQSLMTLLSKHGYIYYMV